MENSMKKFFTLLGLSSALVLSPASADQLKNSLTNMLNTKDTSGMVDLGNINLNAKAKPKIRSGETVIATVNGHNVIKKDADAYLKQRTQGKVTDFDRLPPEQRPRLIQELALPIVVLDAAKKELSKEEKQAVYTRAWTQKEALKIKVSDDQAIEVYNQLKKQSEENNATKEMPPFESIKDRLKMQIIEKTLVQRVMKNAEIKVQ
jgi:membrane-bound ClpP family serine protease